MIQSYSPTQLKEIKGKFDEISASYTRVSAEKDLVKEIFNDLKDEYELPPKTARKLAKAYHKRNLAEVRAEHEEFEEAYETVFEKQP
jgi:Transcriptional regulator DsbA